MAHDPQILITFQNNERVFFPGLPIIGYVTVSSINGISCKAISLELKGTATVHFTRRESVKDGTNTKSEQKHFRSSEKYYTIYLKLWNGDDNNQLNGGSHQFPFTFMLPSGTPSSFESKIGNVRHVCKATIERSFFKRNSRCIMPFSVISICDLNMMPNAMTPILASDDKTLCCLCCASGPLSVLINLSRTGYVPGENIIINAECSNKSNTTMKCTEAKLLQKIVYKAQGRTEETCRVVSTMKHPAILPGGDHYWSGELFPIPPLPPSGLPGCSIIDIEYIFEFAMVPSGMGMSLKLSEKIIIATIPLQRNFNQFVPRRVAPPIPTTPMPEPTAPPAIVDNPPPYSAFAGSSGAGPSAPQGFPGLDLYPNMPPPSYSECAFGLQALEYDTSDNEGEESEIPQKFAPQYVSYNLGQTSGAVNPAVAAAGGEYGFIQSSPVYPINPDFGTNATTDG